MTANEFISKWRKAALTESSASQQHFLDLCEVMGHPKPAEADPTGDFFTFEKGATKDTGGEGWADVWKKGCFGWEYKGKHKDLSAAYRQLLQYRDSLENPPLLVVCDMDRIVIHTNFTGTVSKTYNIPLAELDSPDKLAILHAVFESPEKLRPGVTSASITADAAGQLADIAQSMRKRGLDSQAVAHFLDRVVFCMFAEDIGLLPEKLFSRIVDKGRDNPDAFHKMLSDLFDAMANGGTFGADVIRRFNGNLYTTGPVLELTEDEIMRVHAASKLDWSAVDPCIFGTLFERGMDPAKRSQIGAHYTSPEDIRTLVEPVVMQPLRRQWAAVRQTINNLLATGKKHVAQPGAAGPQKTLSVAAQRKAAREAATILRRFHEDLAHVTVLDPACGSGNFLYVTLQKLKDLEKEVINYGTGRGLGTLIPAVGPTQLFGIEINAYAFDLAQMTIWIGYLQWTKANGFGWPADPVLRPMEKNFSCMDAILDLSDPDYPKEPEWPKVDFIVGNPPFLGGKILRRELGDEYVENMFALWKGRVPAEADLCCYWFEKARRHIEEGKCRRAGLLATQGIRGGANREVLKRIKETGDIFFAESDRPWVLDGANVHVSIVGFDDGAEKARVLDGHAVDEIGPQLATAAATHAAGILPENVGMSFMGVTPAGPFDVEFVTAFSFLSQPNACGIPNSTVVKPFANGKDLNQRSRGYWTVDFGTDTDMCSSARFEAPFEYVRTNVKPIRDHNRRDTYREHWWLYAEPRPAMRAAIALLPRFLCTTRVSKHRLFVWMQTPTIPDSATFVFARSDDYFFGVLHSRLHEVWALKLGTRLETRPRYTPTTCFETFPFPWPPGQEPKDDPRVMAIAQAAKELDELRSRWLNPPEWTREEVLEFPGSVDGPWARYIVGSQPRAAGHINQEIGTVRYPRIVAKDAECAKKLAKRTLTNLYNERPTWLDLAHRKLDEAVFAAYGWDAGMGDEEILERVLAKNIGQVGR
jgi:type II restriction/modification system DNA methylase subunit YeeA